MSVNCGLILNYEIGVECSLPRRYRDSILANCLWNVLSDATKHECALKTLSRYRPISNHWTVHSLSSHLNDLFVVFAQSKHLNSSNFNSFSFSSNLPLSGTSPVLLMIFSERNFSVAMGYISHLKHASCFSNETVR